MLNIRLARFTFPPAFIQIQHLLMLNYTIRIFYSKTILNSNTTLVNVKFAITITFFIILSDSNTTLVNVKFNIASLHGLIFIIQIQHLLMLNQKIVLDWYKKFQFKYNTC